MRARAAAGALLALWALPASAQPAPPPPPGGEATEGAGAVVWPTVTPAGDGAAGGELRQPSSKDGALAERAREVDAIVTDTAQDLGLSVDVGSRGPRLPRALRDAELVEAAKAAKAWIISPRIERDGGHLLVRIVAVPPGSKVVLVREERATPETLAVRVVVMLRDLVSARQPSSPASEGPKRHSERDEGPEPKGRARSSGRAGLSFAMAAFGGYVGYALQKSSRGDDPRLLYPLMAIGTGVGLGAATIVADEWDVGVGDAWFLAAGAAWPAISTMLLTTGYGVEPPGDRHAFALVAGLGGMGLATVALSQRGVSEGSALLTHSGAALGTFLGGMTELAARGTTDTTPYRGLGYGAGAGLLLAGITATRIDVSASRVLSADLGAGIGALAGAAAGSPLLLKNTTEGRQRAWLGITMAGTVAGAAVGLWVSSPSPSSKAQGALSPEIGLPTPGVVAVTPTRSGGEQAAPGLFWGGRF